MSDLSAAIRHAMAREEFEKAKLLWNEYARHMAEDVRSGSAKQTQLAEVRQLMEWCRRVALASRAQAAARLKILRVAETYRRPGGVSAPAVIRASL
ncbi:MAG TPA: hypothetical protein VG675_21880 [Bryobacteraceae bacterium]|nr:hypothetical protein [Bryobacteraceae bacterium]